MELDRRLKTTRKKISRTMLYSVVTRNSQCRIYRVRELDGRLKTTRKKISRMMHSTQYIQLNGIWSIGTTLQWVVVNISVSCDDYERPIQCVVLNWEENYNELGSIGAANTVQKMYICPIEFRGSSKMLKIVAKVPKIVAKLIKLLRNCLI